MTFVVESRFECWAERRSVGGIVICVAGEIDLLSVPPLESTVRDQLNGSSVGNTVELDLARVVFLSARGISALVAASQTAAQRGVVFRVTACHPIARRVIDIVGVAELLGLPTNGAAPDLALPTH